MFFFLPAGPHLPGTRRSWTTLVVRRFQCSCYRGAASDLDKVIPLMEAVLPAETCAERLIFAAAYLSEWRRLYDEKEEGDD